MWRASYLIVLRDPQSASALTYLALDHLAIHFVPEKEVTLEPTKVINVQLRLNNATVVSNFNTVH